MGFDWENEKRLLSSMTWSKNPSVYSNLVKQIMDEFADLGKAALARSLDQCDVSKAGVVPCNLLYFPHSEHRCQMVQRLSRVYDDIAKHCNPAWQANFGGKVATLLNNNQDKAGAPCPTVNYL